MPFAGRGLHGLAQLLGQLRRTVQVGAGQQHHEFFTAVAAQHIGRTQALAQHADDVAQHVVAGQMAVVVIDALEVVDVHHQQRQGRVLAAGAGQLGLQRLHQGAAVGGTGQRVLAGQAQVGLIGTLFGHKHKAK